MTKIRLVALKGDRPAKAPNPHAAQGCAPGGGRGTTSRRARAAADARATRQEEEVHLITTVDSLSARIKGLLRLHCAKLTDIHELWVVRMGNGGPAEALSAVANGDFVVERPQ
jgi:hypothetical protein